jgi:hypothetical protein
MMMNGCVKDNLPPENVSEASPHGWGAHVRRALVPAVVAVSVALPLVIVWAIALVPIGVRAIPDPVIAQATLSPDVVKMLGDRVVHWLLTPCIVVFVVAHLVAVPWAVAPLELRRRARRVYWISIGALTGLAVVIGGPAWIWIVNLPS